MKPIAIFQHVISDGPAYFAHWLIQAGLPYEVFHLYAGDAVPADISAYSGLGIMGGPMSVNDGLPYQAGQLDAIRRAVELDIPVIGHCLGGQLMSKALGGTVDASPNVEIGWSDLRLEAEVGARWFLGRRQLRQFQWHGESFSIPPGARRIVVGELCPNQAFVVGEKHLAMQFHCEVNEEKVRAWLHNDRQELISQSPGVQQADAILPTLAADVANSQRIAADIYAEWVKGLRY
ncbi:MAG: type 1 glutamine amidotransferase [Burkholderiales bacterium]|nr:type 1 glutamine amidotransferase [Burkholderiales bacterium]